MEKSVLSDYIDACEFLKETEKEIKKLEGKRRIVQDKVKGSNPEWPYEERSFALGGVVETDEDSDRLRHERRLREIQREAAEELKLRVEEWMINIPFRMQRIIKYKFFNRLSWDEVAVLLKAKSGESIRKEFENFMKQ
ncbi:RNA polymerase subunit sigma-70 [Bariatricus massiliensis]|uniref:RNA polymerase subunit sigma-70 n=1 Tax=Bariatricus massiliensis TaxID=1745713 RepID=A0ABS8DHE1_9FIRM|nr:RNA polymerase subunit sigma-70 [Bariatricus massiliensis]MCB7304841.1 RNA polymerase subunit sigma-70 [Bariatricus massiliensis]MCB7375395.1 RNA polymerase subunit sigma-70 [Bariatricus massiliensis]MCB7387855.1 RNA polymerase subunit sigma-70 [Bariatricus massiliensis]MCB7412056.1 RNA polymerase subunit sigma-70 [Bariatricus massiliensis]MCQ5254564.1 RNA polymerase subunit sigma-70 [Bariatricus massiliensis]